MLDHIIEKAREEEIFSREDTPTEQRVLAGFMYHAGLSFRRIEPFVDACHVAIHDWYHRLDHLFEPDRDRLASVAVDETKLEIEDEEVYVWAAVNVDTFEVLHIDVSPGRSGLDALFFLKEVLKYCRSQPVRSRPHVKRDRRSRPACVVSLRARGLSCCIRHKSPRSVQI